ncbi:MAG: type II toxin-antitoxin system YafQ family toxin [Oscillospiraceae bacterium]|jgi:mRNA interferase YafQ|nr:type II toxin-antitoxin system YafQ family toxin [Oscillospiraceae bacterium]
MLTIKPGSRFRRDLKTCDKRGLPMKRLREVMNNLSEGKPLDPIFKDHPLKGDMKGYRECHVYPDWLFIYAVDETNLYAARTGSHADIYGL